jgi:OOP family OmpA-OmpF porin
MKTFTSTYRGQTACRCLIAVAGLLAAHCAGAQGWLAGGAVGQARQYDYSVGGPIATTDDTDTGFRVFGGFMFHPNFGGILSYVDLGKPYYDGPAFGGFTDELSAKGVDLSFVAGWAPGTQDLIRLFSTVGIFRWQQDVLYVDDSGVYDYNDKGTSLSYSAGVELSLGKGAAWGMHVAYQRFLDVGDNNNSGHEYDRSMVEVGFEYRFGN